MITKLNLYPIPNWMSLLMVLDTVNKTRFNMNTAAMEARITYPSAAESFKLMHKSKLINIVKVGRNWDIKITDKGKKALEKIYAWKKLNKEIRNFIV